MNPRIVLVLNGHRDDRGFVQEGLEGAEEARALNGFDLEVIEHTERDPALLERQVEAAAARGALGVIVHGSRADAPIAAIAPRYPECRFLSPGGHARGPNVWNYAVRHYEAAFLAGVLAARTTRTGKVGHLSGVPIAPGKRGRAAYVAGVRRADPAVEIVTGFCGDQDDPALARRWVEAEADQGIDILFTMLNFGRSGAIEACRARGLKQIGNIRDWTLEEPDVFIGSAIARHRWSVRAWIADLLGDRLKEGVDRRAGLDEPDAVRLAVGETVPVDVADELDRIAAAIIGGEQAIAESYDGPEFAPPSPNTNKTGQHAARMA